MLARLRFLFWSIVSGALVLVVVGILVPGGSGSYRWFPAAVAVFGAGAMGASRWSSARALDASDPQRLAASFVRATIVGAALAESPAVIGSVGSMATGDPWPAIVGGAWALLAFSFVAPSETNLDRRETQLRSQGSWYSLREALGVGEAPSA